MKERINILKNVVFIIGVILYFYFVFVGRNQYLFHMSYVKCIFFVLVISLFLYFYGIVVNNDKTYKKNIILYILLYYLLLISVTFFIGRTSIKFYDWWYAGQYIPFHTILSQFQYGSNISILKNIIGNSVMLIPLSFLLMIQDKKYNNIFRQAIIILPTIIGIEVFQAFTHTGSFDIDDIILNYFGTVIFTFIITRFSMMSKIRNLFYTDFKMKNTIKYSLFFSSLFLFIIFIILLCFKVI